MLNIIFCHCVSITQLLTPVKYSCSYAMKIMNVKETFIGEEEIYECLYSLMRVMYMICRIVLINIT